MLAGVLYGRPQEPHPALSQSNVKFKKYFPNCQQNRGLFADSPCFSLALLSPHPASAAVGRIVEATGGVGEQGAALVLQVEEVAV